MFRKILFFTMLITLAYSQGKVPNVRLKMLDGSSAKLYDYLKDGPMIIKQGPLYDHVPSGLQRRHFFMF